MDKEYVVTLHRKEDLQQFYNEMQLTNFPLVLKRPLSRNTHYMMTEEQAEQLRQDPRVWGVEAVDSFKIARQAVNNEPYVKSGNFWKDDTVAPTTVSSNDFQWGHLHCAGNQAQRGKGQFGMFPSFNGSVNFDGNASYLYLNSPSELALGTGDFTIECWFRATAWDTTGGYNSNQIFDFREISASLQLNLPALYITQTSGNSGNIHYFVDNENRISGNVSLNNWYHVAISRVSGTTTMYLNGSSVGAWADNTNYTVVSNNRPIIGSNGGFADVTRMIGQISNFRIVKGTSVYTANFTPPNENLTNIPGTVLLTCQDNTILDNSNNNFPINVNGNASVSSEVPISDTTGYYESVSDAVEVFNNGRHVDVVIVDDPVSYDSGEWESPSAPGQSRFVQYQWFNELNSFVGSIDDDGQVLPTGTITYETNANTPQYHGIHVTGTACGQHYGWANEANIYNIAVTDAWTSGQQVSALLIFDYLRAFHLNKAINPETGFRNPTVTNHSYGGVVNMTTPSETLQFGDLTEVFYQGTVYNAGNPGPSGWTEAGVEADFGVRFGLSEYPSWSSAVAADVQDAIEDGVVVIGAAGNDNLLMAEVDDLNWNNILNVNNGNQVFYYSRGAWPNSPDSGAITVGALSKRADLRRSTYTNFGPAVDVFAPGDNILSAYGNTGGLNDSKYPAGNYFYPIQGTSMASPQVCGVISCLATGKERFTQADALGYLNQFSIYGDMTFDVAGGGLDDNSCRQGSLNKYLHIENPRPVAGFIQKQKGNRTATGMTFPRISTLNSVAPSAAAKTFPINVINSGASHYVFNGDDRSTTHVDAFDPVINVNVGDTLEFSVNASGHPFYIKTSATTGTSNQVTTGTITGNGASVGTVTWDTTGVTPGTYYYICQFHSGMTGQIIVS